MAESKSNIVERLTEYIHVKTEQFKLKLIQGFSTVLANVISFAFLAVFGILFIFFLSFGLGALLNSVLNSAFYGHLIIAGFYLLVILIIFLLMKSNRIKGWFESLILKAIEKEDESEN